MFTVDMGERQVNEEGAKFPDIPAPVIEIRLREGISALIPNNNDRRVSQNVKCGYLHDLGNMQKSPKPYQLCFSIGA